MLAKTKIDYNSQQRVYDDIIKIGHEIEDASLNLLIEVAQIELNRFRRKANTPAGARHPIFTKSFDQLISQVSGYTEKLKQRLEELRNNELDKRFTTIVQNYPNLFKEKNRQFTNGYRLLRSYQEKRHLTEYSAKFLMVFTGIIALYPCLYKMNETTRYPMKRFGYRNLSHLNKKAPCNTVIIMTNSLVNTYRWFVENQHLLGE
jgi:hypothetical protein